jgi:hypothetical protein
VRNAVKSIEVEVLGMASSGIYINTLTDVASDEINTETVTDISINSIIDNEPSKITFIVPADLPAGDYKLSITTQFSANVLLKEPRTYIFGYVLECNQYR